MTLIGKLLISFTAIAIPASTITAISLLKPFSKKFPKWLEELKGECYVIPTSKSQKERLLVCANSDDLSSSDSLYFLFDSSNKKVSKKISQIIKSKNLNQITIKLEGQQYASNSTLDINGKDWQGIKEDLNLKSACSLIAPREKNGNWSWQCNSGFATESTTIKLTKFTEY